jgi:hypothetical protein
MTQYAWEEVPQSERRPTEERESGDPEKEEAKC